MNEQENKIYQVHNFKNNSYQLYSQEQAKKLIKKEYPVTYKDMLDYLKGLKINTSESIPIDVGYISRIK